MTLTVYIVCCALLAILSEPASSECPNPSDLPVNWNSTHYLAVTWFSFPTSSNPIQSCKGGIRASSEGFDETTLRGSMYVEHALVVRPGCIVYEFSDYDYQGTVTEYPTGVYPQIPVGSKSMKARCNIAHVNCIPTDRYETVLICDATSAVEETACSYIRTIGTTFSSSVSTSMSLDATLEASMAATFYAIFSATLKASVSTGISWNDISEQTKQKSVTMEVKAKAPAGYILKIEQAVGRCGGSKINSEFFRISHYGNKKRIIDTKNFMVLNNKTEWLNVKLPPKHRGKFV